MYYYLAARLLDPAAADRNLAVALRLFEDEKSRLGRPELVDSFLSHQVLREDPEAARGEGEMNSEERREIWEGLGLIEDWLGGGARSAPAPLPDIAAGESLEAIALEIEACRGCRLCETRTRAVPGQGSRSPLAMIVGEGPGAEEDAQGLPFVGPAGKLLDKMLASIGLSRQENCFIANVVKCRPPQNRDPAPDEQAACLGLPAQADSPPQAPGPPLRRAHSRPRPSWGRRRECGKMRGAWRDFEGLPLLVTYHPSALLRDDSYKRPAWEDLKLFRERLSPDS